MIIDTHIHLQDEKYKDLIDEIILGNAKENIKCLCVSVDKKTSLDAIKLAKKFNSIYPMIGIHPQDIKGESLSEIERIFYENKDTIKGIGEIGLDKHWDSNEPIDIQKKFFKFQIELAIKNNLPISVHARDAMCDVISVLDNYKGKVKGVLHCFQGSLDEARKILEIGLLIGVGGILTYKNSDELADIVKNIPLDKIVLETDGPYLSPFPNRGKINRPVYLIHVASKIAEIKNVTADEVLRQTEKNAIKLFNL